MMDLRSDGWQLLNIPFWKTDDLKEQVCGHGIMQATECIQSGAYGEAEKWVEKAYNASPKHKMWKENSIGQVFHAVLAQYGIDQVLRQSRDDAFKWLQHTFAEFPEALTFYQEITLQTLLYLGNEGARANQGS